MYEDLKVITTFMATTLLLKFALNDMPHIIGMDRTFNPGSSTEEIAKGGTCYEDALRFLIKEEEGELVHGSVESKGKRINHAWVELPTDFIWEPGSGKFIRLEDFGIALKPQVYSRYTAEEAAIMALRTHNSGPWEEEERRQWLMRGKV